ncbi:CDGSH iron-sulfur domain-containing protein [Chlorobium sp. KB01]|uniref:CDGSH iron-sulfur domain-containing protein n=1 Tax=Chlorobium sp. KB01 TaxID=1917528 RepID=UPI0009772E9E|nr:CDGSH iron-sulfur domain-containing protein [Chlorobium sp. KB01]
MEQKKPYIIKEQPGTKYYCACSKSKNLPYCDGSHKGSGLHPVKVEIDEEKTVAICSCGLSANPPYCDGSHKSAQ